MSELVDITSKIVELFNDFTGEFIAGSVGVAAASVRLFFWRQFLKLVGILQRSEYEEHYTGFYSTEAVIDIQIKDAGGANASITYQNAYKFTKSKLSKYVISLTAEGEISLEKPGHGVIEKKEHRGGCYYYVVDTGQEVTKGDVFETNFTALLENTFLNNKENWTHDVLIKTKLLIIRIRFPSDRPLKVHHLTQMIGGHRKRLMRRSNIVSLGDQKYVECKIKNPKLGARYMLEWRW